MIRHLGPEDIGVFKRLRLEALRMEPAAFASRTEDWEALPEAEWLRRLTANPVFAAFRDGEPVGMMGLLQLSPSKWAHRAEIIMVYVRASERGGGVAVALLDALTAHARAMGIRQLELSVSAENPAAIRFYERRGYERTGCIPGGFVHEGREIDDILMARRIDG